MALGLNALVPRLKRVSPATKTILTRLVPFAAVASAGALNVFLMRGEEIRLGIDVYPVLSEADKANLQNYLRGLKSVLQACWMWQSVTKRYKRNRSIWEETAIDKVVAM